MLILSASLLAACSDKKPVAEPTTATTAAVTTQAQTTSVSTTAEPTTSELTTVAPTTVLSTAHSTTKKAQATKPVSVTEKTTQAAVTVSGRKYKESKVENVKLKYGVVMHKYKTIYYQMVDGEKVVYNTEVTDYHVNRLGYSASYEDLLPSARENRETYRSYINKNLKIINEYRAEKGIAPLRLNEELTIMACARAEEIAWSGEHSHTRPNGSSCFSIFREAGFESGTAGENLGYGFWTPEEVCEAWKESRTHYENLMNPKFVEIGIGVAADPDEKGKLCWANHFLSE